MLCNMSVCGSKTMMNVRFRSLDEFCPCWERKMVVKSCRWHGIRALDCNRLVNMWMTGAGDGSSPTEKMWLWMGSCGVRTDELRECSQLGRCNWWMNAFWVLWNGQKYSVWLDTYHYTDRNPLLPSALQIIVGFLAEVVGWNAWMKGFKKENNLEVVVI